MRPGSGSGFTLLEALLALAILAILGGLLLGSMDAGSAALTAVQGELRGGVEQAFLLARARGSEVQVGFRRSADSGLRPLQLPRGVVWGLPDRGIPLPPGMAPTIRAQRTGEAHPVITVTPEGTATASAWFLTDGKDALCLRLSGHGRFQLLRWRRRLGRWGRV